MDLVLVSNIHRDFAADIDQAAEGLNDPQQIADAKAHALRKRLHICTHVISQRFSNGLNDIQQNANLRDQYQRGGTGTEESQRRDYLGFDLEKLDNPYFKNPKLASDRIFHALDTNSGLSQFIQNAYLQGSSSDIPNFNAQAESEQRCDGKSGECLMHARLVASSAARSVTSTLGGSISSPSHSALKNLAQNENLPTDEAGSLICSALNLNIDPHSRVSNREFGNILPEELKALINQTFHEEPKKYGQRSTPASHSEADLASGLRRRRQ